MRRTITLRTALLLSVLCFPPVPLKAADHFVDIYSNGYEPQNKQIAPGDTVHWINWDLVGHTVTSSNNLWAPGYLFDYASEFTHTFNSVGTYAYYCQYA